MNFNSVSDTENKIGTMKGHSRKSAEKVDDTECFFDIDDLYDDERSGDTVGEGETLMLQHINILTESTRSLKRTNEALARAWLYVCDENEDLLRQLGSPSAILPSNATMKTIASLQQPKAEQTYRTSISEGDGRLNLHEVMQSLLLPDA